MSAPLRKRNRAAASAAETGERIAGAVVGRVGGFERGEIRVSFQGADAEPVEARALADFDDTALERAAREHAEAVLLFEGGDPMRPLLVGLLRSATPLVDALLAERGPQAETVARVDGKRVYVEGKEEIVLQCGKASLTLRRDGRVVLRGVNVVTQAEQVHKIRGGKVQVN